MMTPDDKTDEKTDEGRLTMRRRMTMTMLCVTVVCLALPLNEIHADDAPPSYYLIGNSLTWDTIPGLLDGDVQWHVGCGKSLPYLYANPENPCVKTSTLWPTALKEKQYDVVSVQPHYGATLAQDVAAISAWMKMQPRAVFVIHSGWARHASRVDEFTSLDPLDEMQHSPAYYRALIAELRKLHPGRELRQTRAIHLLAKVAEDIAAKKAPFAEITDLHRDVIHMKHESGKYLMHNAMRQALGQPRSARGFEKMDAGMRKYLDGVLALLSVGSDDQGLLRGIMASGDVGDRAAMVAKVADNGLRNRLTDMLPEIERAVRYRRQTRALRAEVEKVGGVIQYAPSGPQWLYLGTDDDVSEIFEVPVVVNLYNGNNPLKGRGGRNDLVTDSWLEKLVGMSTLQRLDVSNCEIRGDGLRHVGTLANLRELNLTLTPVSDDGLAHLGGLTELRKLGLASTQCTGTGFVHLSRLGKLSSVNFHFTPLSDAGLLAISKVGISDRFWFAHTQFTDAGARCLASLTKMRRCGIGSKHAASSGAAVAALSALRLVDLALLDNQASPTGVSHAAKIESLRRLDVSYAPRVGDAELKQLARMPHLQELKIGSAAVTDDGLLALAESSSLRKLTLNRLRHVTAAGVERLKAANPKLIVEFTAVP